MRFISSFAAGLALSSVLLASAFLASEAQAAPIEISERAQAQLDDGRGIPVIVRLTEDTGLTSAMSYELRAAHYADRRDEVFERVFGAETRVLTAIEPGEAGPRIRRVFSSIPGASMVLNREQIEALAADKDVFSIVEDELHRPTLAESVPLIGADLVHAGGNTGAGVSIAILDTGVDNEHPAMAAGIVDSVCFSSTVPGQSATGYCPNGLDTDTTSANAGDNCEELGINPLGAEGCFHGTHVAGIAAGRASSQVALDDPGGVASGAGIVGVQVFSEFDDEDICDGASSTPCVLSFSSDQLGALEWLFQNRDTLSLAAINMSLGGGPSNGSHCSSDPLNTIINALRDEGIATVISSGNDGFSNGVSSPACVEGAITVGSTTKSDARSSFSNSSPLVDMLAPGSSIRAALVTIDDVAATGGGTTASGTSMAAPHIAGVFALLRAAHPTASMDEIETALDVTGVKITDSRNGVTLPRVRVDLADAFLTTGGAAGDLDVSPFSTFQTAGTAGEANGFDTQDYVLTNTGNASINWTASSDEDWITVSQASGTLAPGADVTVTVGVNGSTLGGGMHLGEVDFGIQGGATTQRPIRAVTTAPPPTNDDFADAWPLAGVDQLHSYSTVDATKEGGEPNHGNNRGGASVWFAWTAPVTGRVEIRTINTDYDTTIGVYTGSVVGGLATIAVNDDFNFPASLESAVEIDAEAGTTYMIAVDGYNGASGTGDIRIRAVGAPPNDDFDDAEGLSGSHGAVIGSTLNATKEIGEANHAGETGGASVWYGWLPPSSGDVVISTQGALFDTVLAVYTSPDGGATLTPVASNNDAKEPEFASPATTGSSEVSFTASFGTFYYIAVDGVGGDTGLFRLAWRSVDNANHSLRASVLPNARSVVVGQPATAFATVINPRRFGVDGENCRIEAPLDMVGGLSFQTTDPATNALTGSSNTAVGIDSDSAQTFLISFTAGEEMNGEEIAPVFVCDNIAPAPINVGVNTFTLTASPAQTADVVAIALTIDGDGVARPPVGSRTVFPVSALNIGPDETLTVRPRDLAGDLPMTLDICQTNPVDGRCLPGGRASEVDVLFENGVAKTFSVRISSTGGAIPAAPSTNRVVVDFIDGSGRQVGSTSVAVETQ